VIAQAEVPEADARGRVGDIYADIRATLQVPMVNTIYRHLATLPAALEWAWSSIRPHMLSGDIARQAAVLRQDVQVDLDAGGPAVHPRRERPEPAQAQCAIEVVRAYDTANRLNLVALAHLLRAAAAAPDAPCPAASRADLSQPEPQADPGQLAPATQGALLRIPALDALTPELRARVQRLNRYGESAEPQVVAGLYRQLAIWPHVLETVEAWLQPWEQRGILHRARGTAARSVARQASLQPLRMAAPSAEVAARYSDTLRLYSAVVIPKMIPIGLLLRGFLDSAQEAAC